jgi:hypothetical protein
MAAHGEQDGPLIMRKVEVRAVPARVKTAVAYLIEQKADLALAAAAAGLTVRELRRQMGKPEVRRYSLEQRALALDAFCLGSPAALTEIRDTSENSMARVQAIRTGEILRTGAIEDEVTAQRRGPGLQIVIVQPSGAKELVPMMPTVPMLDTLPAPEPEPVPVIPAEDDAPCERERP